MNKYFILALKAARMLYFRKRRLGPRPFSGVAWNDTTSPEMLANLVKSDKPYMIARFGATEMDYIANKYAIKHGWSALQFIKGEVPLLHKDDSVLMSKLCNLSGFFPDGNPELGERFYQLMLDCIPELDLLGSWMSYESLFAHMHNASHVNLANLEPFDSSGKPWSKYLEGKKVLVVHPFASTIERQYATKREVLFENPDVLPEFELLTIPAVQSLGGCKPEGLDTWFDAFDHMKKQIDVVDYDVCLLGCGAYGFPLAAHVKRQGKQAIHMAGALQLLFGIKGKRWTEQYGSDGNNPYLKLFNENWVFPDAAEKPASADKVEDACYW